MPNDKQISGIVWIDGQAYAPNHPKAILHRPSPGMEAPEPIRVPCCERDTEYHGYCDVHPKPRKRLRQSSKPLMNKLEQERYDLLKTDSLVANLRAQSLTFRLANGLRFTPDLTYDLIDGSRYVDEVKGKHTWDDSLAKLKMAASVYPEWRWRLVWKEDGQWETQEILP